MVLSIKDPETDALARKLAERTNESITEAVKNSLNERLQRLDFVDEKTRQERLAAVREIQEAVRSWGPPDPRSIDELLYDENGLPA